MTFIIGLNKAFDHDVTALAAGIRVALSNFVLIPKAILRISLINTRLLLYDPTEQIFDQ